MLNEKERQVLEQAFVKVKKKVLSLAAAREISAAVSLPLRKIEWFALEKGVVPGRYQRNIGSIGIEGQKKLLESKVVVVGLGGLGGFVCEELARLGTGTIAVIDHDKFDETNLNRQLNSSENNIGKVKAEQTKQRVSSINSAVEITVFDSKFNDVPKEVWLNCDLVMDCLDNINDRLILAGKCAEFDKPLIHGAVAGWYGEVGVVWPASHLLEDVYRGQEQGMEKTLGTPPFTVAAASSIMTAEAVKVLMGKATQGEGKIHFFDLMQDVWQSVIM